MIPTYFQSMANFSLTLPSFNDTTATADITSDYGSNSTNSSISSVTEDEYGILISKQGIEYHF